MVKSHTSRHYLLGRARIWPDFFGLPLALRRLNPDDLGYYYRVATTRGDPTVDMRGY